MKRTLLDSGPLAAFFSTRDRHHDWAFAQFHALRPPILSCEAVLSEACFLLQRDKGRPAVILRAVREGIIQIAFDLETEAAALESLMQRYADTPMSLADACLVRLSELHADCRVFTLDSHFKRYRRQGRQLIPLLSPW
ncbi:MAG: PIN domain-containing protein [Chthoniobacterales bacterium]